MPCSRLALFEQLRPSVHLRITRVFDFQPGRPAPVALIHAAHPLRHDTLKIALTREPIQLLSLFLDSIEIQQSRCTARNNCSESFLALEQLQRRQIVAVYVQHIERVEVRALSPEHQTIEVTSPMSVKAADLAIEHSRSTLRNL